MCFLDDFRTRTNFFPTSADTSSTQRTRRPLVAAGILTARFGPATFAS
jgi:hypothetical protein